LRQSAATAITRLGEGVVGELGAGLGWNGRRELQFRHCCVASNCGADVNRTVGRIPWGHGIKLLKCYKNI